MLKIRGSQQHRQPIRLRLCGGGEGSLNNGTTGWGSPPTNPNNPNAGTWGAASTVTTQQQSQISTTSGGTNSNNNNNNNPQSSWGNSGAVGGSNVSGGGINNVSQNNQQQQAQRLQSQQQQQSSGGLVQQQQPPGSLGTMQSDNNKIAQQQSNLQVSSTGGVASNNNNWTQSQKPNSNNNQTTMPQPKNNPNISVNNSTNNNNNNPNIVGVGGIVGGGTSTAAAKNQLEQLNNMREALFSQDGWGCQHVNQDTNWDVPGSPEPGSKIDNSTNNVAGGVPGNVMPGGGTNTVSGVSATWKQNVNNGTELWEANLRNGGQPPVQPIQKTPWGHTPSSNIGGTWGEDDDGGDSGNVWSGNNSSSNNPNVGGNVGTGPGNPQWNQSSSIGIGGGNGTGNNIVSGGNNVVVPPASTITGLWQPNTNIPGNPVLVQEPKKNNDWGNSAPGNVNNWGDLRDIRGTGASGSAVGGNVNVNNAGVGGNGSIDMRNVDPRELRGGGGGGGGGIESREQIRMLDPREMRDLRGDPRGISGRLNGGTTGMWDHHTMANMPINKIVGPGANNGGVGVGVGGGGNAPWVGSIASQKDLNKPGTGWEEPSPPAVRRNMPNFDDGTSLWGQQPRVAGVGNVGVGGGGGGGGVSNSTSGHWKDLPDGMSRGMVRGGNQAGVNVPNIPQGRLGPMKPDNMWGHGGATAGNVGGGGGIARNGSWDDSTHSSNWDDKGQGGSNAGNAAATSWNDSSGVGATTWIKNKSQLGNLSGAGGSQVWPDNDISNNNDWSGVSGGHGLGPKPQNKSEMIRSSKQYRMLCEMGFKKDDIEIALRSTNMNLDESMEMLNQQRSNEWRRHDDAHSSVGAFDPNSFSGANRFGAGGGGNVGSSLNNFPPVRKYNNIMHVTL